MVVGHPDVGLHYHVAFVIMHWSLELPINKNRNIIAVWYCEVDKPPAPVGVESSRVFCWEIFTNIYAYISLGSFQEEREKHFVVMGIPNIVTYVWHFSIAYNL
jgi:hypothetical protein